MQQDNFNKAIVYRQKLLPYFEDCMTNHNPMDINNVDKCKQFAELMGEEVFKEFVCYLVATQHSDLEKLLGLNTEQLNEHIKGRIHNMGYIINLLSSIANTAFDINTNDNTDGVGYDS